MNLKLPHKLFALLVLTGVVGSDDLPVEPRPDEVAPDLLGLVERHVDPGPRK